MKEEWLMSGAVVPVDAETIKALVAEIRRLIDVVGGMALAQQEPVAWADHGVVNWIADKQFKHASLLYTTPPQRTEQNFCSRCGKRTPDLITIHTCTPLREGT